MKKIINLKLVVAALFLTIAATTAQAQSKPAAQPRYKDLVGDNPTAEADMKVVSDFINALTDGKLDKAKMLMADNYKGYGPSPNDSTTSTKTISAWQENYKTQSNRKVNFITQTFRVKSGDLKGNWVSLWGSYSFTQNAKEVTFPLQYTARVTEGKIDMDRVYYDRLYILESLGYKITPPEATK